MPDPQQNDQLVQRLEGIRQILMAHYSAGMLLPNASKGTERETLLREFLFKVFPPPFRFGSGAIIDQYGLISGQLDIVAEFPFFPSFPTPGASERLYLAESVSFVAEVKSDLAAQWPQVENTAEALLPLRRKWLGHLRFHHEEGLEIANASVSRIPFVAIGFRGYQSVDALESRLRETEETKRPDSVLVLESGAYVGLLSDVRGSGVMGLFQFCVEAAHFATNVLTAHPDFRGYGLQPSG
ncbi:MAG TPA: DUF6602 domain-containing protein [Candidatus Udaeobacter sp.]|jgi:hypothetical protein